MHMVHVPHGRIDQRLKRREPYALENARPEKTSVVFACCAAPDAAHNDDERAQKVDVPLAPDTGAGHEQEASEPDAEEVVAGAQRHVGEGAFEEDGERDGVCGEERREGCRDDGEEREDCDDGVAFPKRPVLDMYVLVNLSVLVVVVMSFLCRRW